MPTYDVAANADDYYWDSDAGTIPDTTTLVAKYIRILFPAVYGYAYAKVDTSAIPDDATILSARAYWYLHNISVTGKNVDYAYTVAIKPDGGSYATFYSFSGAFPPSLGWTNHALTAGELVKISKTSYTWLWFRCPDPVTASSARSISVRAREYVTQDAYDCYLVVTYSTPSALTPKVMVF